MKEKDTFKKIVGVSQEEMAILLGISRTQWSMYECGQRDLPMAAAMEFAKMMEYLKNNSSKKMETKAFLKEEKIRIQDILNKAIKKNEYKIFKLNEKIERAERLYHYGVSTLRMVDYLDTQPDNERSSGLKEVLKAKALVSLRKNKDRIRKYSYDKEMIELQNNLMRKDFAKGL